MTAVWFPSFHHSSSLFCVLDKNTYERLESEAEQAMPALPLVFAKVACDVHVRLPKSY